jgi:hypothetical protein
MELQIQAVVAAAVILLVALQELTAGAVALV